MGPARLRRLGLAGGARRRRRRPGVMRAETHEPIRIVGARAPGTRSRAVARHRRLRHRPEPHRLGRRFAVEAPAGTPIEIFYSEKLASDGTREHRRQRARVRAAADRLLRGARRRDGDVAPRFTYKGFQYVQLSAPGRQPLPAGVTASRRSAWTSGAHERCLDVEASRSAQPTLSRIHRNTSWAIQSNMHGIITDTPVYEKNGWTGDAQLTSGTASLLFDTERLYRKMFQDMADAQTAQGEVPLLARATATTATSASRRSSPRTAAARRRRGTRSGS